MAIVKNGVNGNVSGKVGNVVFCKWKDINYVRSMPRIKKDRKPSADQQSSRNKFKLIQRILSSFVSVLRIGFKSVNRGRSAYSNAMSYNLNEAVLKTEDGFMVDWDRFRFSKGFPNPIISWQMEVIPEKNILRVVWEFDQALEVKYDLRLFRCYLVFYPDDYDLFYIVRNSYHRCLNDYEQELELSSLEKEVDYHVHIAFVAHDGSDQVTDSKYLGKYRFAAIQ